MACAAISVCPFAPQDAAVLKAVKDKPASPVLSHP
jgi:hypothetical protein